MRQSFQAYQLAPRAKRRNSRTELTVGRIASHFVRGVRNISRQRVSRTEVQRGQSSPTTWHRLLRIGLPMVIGADRMRECARNAPFRGGRTYHIGGQLELIVAHLRPYLQR